ncbi:hypothetical protein GCM10020000_46970 [Streptomyces olivoverticillatus]
MDAPTARRSDLGDEVGGLLAYFCVWPNVLTILLELFTLYATYSPIDSGPILGDCRFGGP